VRHGHVHRHDHGDSVSTAAGMVSARLRIGGMHCGSCGILIDETLEDVPGVRSSATSTRSGTSRVEFDPQLTDLPTIAAAIVALGYTVEPAEGDGARR
jgi:copper chaperone